MPDTTRSETTPSLRSLFGPFTNLLMASSAMLRQMESMKVAFMRAATTSMRRKPYVASGVAFLRVTRIA